MAGTLDSSLAGPLEETITLQQAKRLIQCMAHEQSFLLLAPPGVGKSETVYQAAQEAGLPCRSLLGTQIAPEDVSGVPRIVGERSVFCPPRLLLPEKPEPFCLFLDELPACAPDVQKAFYSLLLERRVGEHQLPPGTWVVAAGNRVQDRALVRSLSSALVNRVTILHVRVDADEWQAWARSAAVREDVRMFISYMPEALMRAVPQDPVPFSTPRSWTLFARALDLAEAAGELTRQARRALAFGRLSPEDAAVFCALAEESIGAMHPLEHYFAHPESLPSGDTARWFVLNCIRQNVKDGKLSGLEPGAANRFLRSLPHEHQLTLLTDLVDRWGALGADAAMLDLLKQVTHLIVPMVDAVVRARIERGLRMVTVPFPHLAGLVATARVTVDSRLPTIGVFASGRISANPGFVGSLKDHELVFVLAHEMLHLALRTHDRARGTDRLEFNYAHDFIINDILRVELGMPVPAGGLDMPGAREKSAEEIVLEMRRNQEARAKTRVWLGEETSARRLFGAAGGAGEGAEAGDALGASVEAEMYPDEAEDAGTMAERVREMAAKALGLARAMGLARGPRGIDAGTASQTVLALRGLYRTPWELALQRWIESVAPGDRTFNRPSRRGAERADDVVLPGRRREGWILNVVLDTSGSMADEIPRALGTLGEFCDAVGVDRVRLVQCDAALTSDEMLDPHELAERRIEGYGGSDLSPALRHLAWDQHVRAVVVITDGEIAFPEERMPYDLLWLVPASARTAFNPPVRPRRPDAASVAPEGGQESTMKVIQELVAYFERRGRLTGPQIRKLLDQGLLAGDAPPNMVALCDQVGSTFYFRVVGDTIGTVWGTDVYTGDSSLSTAAVHAGLVQPGGSAVVKVTVVPPLGHYQGSVRNGVTSRDFGQFGTAYRVACV